MKKSKKYFDEDLWDNVMSDFFPDAEDEDDIADELDDLWNED